jgi:hypothetical protein
MLQNSQFRIAALLTCLGVVLFLGPPAGAQSNRIPQAPRDIEKLLARAQEFWASVVKDRKAEALELVTPDRRNVYLATKSSPILEATVEGLKWTDSRERAVLSVSVKTVDPVVGPSTWTLTDHWIWSKNNWYANPPLPTDMWNVMNGILPDPEVQKAVKEIEAELSGLPSEIDLGSVLQDTHHPFEIPVQYSGVRTLRLAIDPRPPLSLIDGSFKKEMGKIKAYVDSASIDGLFAIPAKIRFTSGQAVVEKPIVIKGKVFKPLSFRHVPERPSKQGEVFSVFVTNNTSEVLPIQYVAGEFEAEVTKEPTVIGPGQEAEIIFRLIANVPPVRVDVQLKSPVYGRSQYSYIFPKTP